MEKTMKFEIEVATSATKSPGPEGMLRKVLEHWSEMVWHEIPSPPESIGTLELRALRIQVKVT